MQSHQGAMLGYPSTRLEGAGHLFGMKTTLASSYWHPAEAIRPPGFGFGDDFGQLQSSLLSRKLTLFQDLHANHCLRPLHSCLLYPG